MTKYFSWSSPVALFADCSQALNSSHMSCLQHLAIYRQWGVVP